uniref:hypothetical protein n=1 Tax=Natrinema hispanicum TaxID=392421 RepID=UPI0013EE454B|nr:hypothetical protein [Natrinema hispanicum]
MIADTTCGEPLPTPDSAWLHTEHGSRDGSALGSAESPITTPAASTASVKTYAHSSTAPKPASGRRFEAYAIV